MLMFKARMVIKDRANNDLEIYNSNDRYHTFTVMSFDNTWMAIGSRDITVPQNDYIIDTEEKWDTLKAQADVGLESGYLAYNIANVVKEAVISRTQHMPQYAQNPYAVVPAVDLYFTDSNTNKYVNLEADVATIYIDGNEYKTNCGWLDGGNYLSGRRERFACCFPLVDDESDNCYYTGYLYKKRGTLTPMEQRLPFNGVMTLYHGWDWQHETDPALVERAKTNYENFEILMALINGNAIPVLDTDPYTKPDDLDPDEPTPEGGGGKDYDDEGDDVTDPTEPFLNVIDTGMVTVWVPTRSEVESLGYYLWNSNIDTAIKRLFENPMDAILSFHIVPVNVSSQLDSLRVGNVDTGLSMQKALEQFVDVDLGTATVEHVKPYSFLNSSPYIQLSLYLPYIGYVPLDADLVMGRELNLKYRVDVLTGTCIAWLNVSGQTYYQWFGQTARQIPISSLSYSNIISGMIRATGDIAGMIISEGATAPMAMVDLASTAVNMAKPVIQKSNGSQGASAYMGRNHATIYMEYPKALEKANLSPYAGLATMQEKTISGLVSGYFQVLECNLKTTATKEEQDEILSYLKQGVIL